MLTHFTIDFLCLNYKLNFDVAKVHQGDEAKTAELAPSAFDVKSFPRQSRSCGGGIATVYKSTLGSNITFKTNFDFTHTSFEVVQASITLQHNTLHFFCLY